MSFRGHGDYLIVLKAIACLACWCRGKTFPSPRKWCLTTLMTFKISDSTWAVGHPFNLYVGLQGPGWLNVLVMPPRGELLFWTPRARATGVGQGPHLRRGVPAGSLRAMEPIARETTRGRKRKKCRCAKKTHWHIVIPGIIQGSPSGCVRRKIPRVTQVDEKVHEGNTAVVTAYISWRKHRIYIFHEE